MLCCGVIFQISFQRICLKLKLVFREIVKKEKVVSRESVDGEQFSRCWRLRCCLCSGQLLKQMKVVMMMNKLASLQDEQRQQSHYCGQNTKKPHPRLKMTQLGLKTLAVAVPLYNWQWQQMDSSRSIVGEALTPDCQ